jgi:hypothetical protein
LITLVYHAFLTGNWKNVIKQQIGRIVGSGLYSQVDLFFMTVNKQDTPEEELTELLKDYDKIKFEFSENNFAEYPGIKKVKEIADIYDTKILYLHTKGVSNDWLDFATRQRSDEKTENINFWKEALEFFVIDKWKDCVSLLKEYDNVGLSCNSGWYWGNFWWSKSEHIRKTSPVEIWGRWDYEAWLNRGVSNPKNYEFYHLGFDPYITKLLPSFYDGQQIKYKNDKLIIKNATYGTPPFEINEGYHGTPLNVTNDVTEIVRKIVDDSDGTKIHFFVDNDLLGGDPIHGYRKVVLVEFYPESDSENILKIGMIEGSFIDFKF